MLQKSNLYSANTKLFPIHFNNDEVVKIILVDDSKEYLHNGTVTVMAKLHNSAFVKPVSTSRNCLTNNIFPNICKYLNHFHT